MKDEFFTKPLHNRGTFEDLSGQRFDKLLVIRLVGRRLYGERKSGTALWECKCDCGTIKNITASALKNKKAKTKPWVAKIRHNNVNILLGNFKIELDAAKAYNNAAIKYFGEFASINNLKERRG